MKSVTLLFPSAKARLRGPLQLKPSFQPACFSRESKHGTSGAARALLPSSAPSSRRETGGHGTGWRQDAQQQRDRAGTVSTWHGDGKECKDKAQNGANERQRGRKKPALIKAKKCHVSATYCAIVSMR